MRKTFLLIFSLFLTCAFSYSQKDNRSWNFTNWSQETLDNMAADANWKIPTSNDRYNYKGISKDNSETNLTANGIVVAELEGLKFSASGGAIGDTHLGAVFSGTQRLRVGTGNARVTVPDCKAGDILVVITQSANSADIRGLSASNSTRLFGTDKAPGSAGQILNGFEVNADGDVVLTPSNGLEFYSIIVNPQIAYVTASGTAGPEASNDADKRDIVVYPTLAKFGEVTLINAGAYTSTLSENEVKEMFAAYDLVVASETLGGTNHLGLAMKHLIGYKPFLNFKSFFYTVSGRWGWAAPDNGPVDGTARTAIINDKFLDHPIFSTATVNDNTVVIFDELDVTAGRTDKKGVQGFKLPIADEGKGNYLANTASNDAISIHEINTNAWAKYMLLPFCSDNYHNINENGVEVIEQTIHYII